MEKHFVTKKWFVRIATGVFGMLVCVMFNGWTRVLGHPGELKPTVHALGMQLIRRGKTDMGEQLREEGQRARGRQPARE